jgi:hypothetical protein
MAIVAGFDVHRTRITFDALDTETGEVHRGRIPADPESVRGWVGRFEGQRVDVAVEACTYQEQLEGAQGTARLDGETPGGDAPGGEAVVALLGSVSALPRRSERVFPWWLLDGLLTSMNRNADGRGVVVQLERVVEARLRSQRRRCQRVQCSSLRAGAARTAPAR